MNRVKVSPFGKDTFKLIEAYEWQGVVVPKGFISNGANVPRVFWSIYPPNSPEYLSACVIHDYLCDFACKDKEALKYADKMLFEAMKELKVSKLTCYIFYYACRAYHKIKY